MVLDWLDYGIIVAFLSLGIGIYYKNQAESSLTSFFLGGRSLPWYIAGISMVATTFAADTPLAVTELVAKNGIAGNWLWWNAVIGGMLTALFFARLWQRSGVLTEVELISIRYSGKAAEYLRYFKAVYLGVFMNVLVIGWVNLALASLLDTFFDLSAGEVYMLVFGFMLLAAIYTALSGLKGVVITDAIQFVIAMVGCIILAYLVVGSDEIGGVSGLKEKIPASYLNFLPSVGEGSNNSMITLTMGAFISFIGVQWWASWYPGAEPGGGGYIAQRMMSTKSEKDAQYATIFFQIAHYCVRPWPWIMVGICAVVLYSASINNRFSPQQTAVIESIENLKGSDDGRVASLSDKQKLDLIKSHAVWTNLSPEQQKTMVFQFQERNGYAFVMKDFLPTGLRGLLLVAFLAAYLSTISTQLNWGASYIVNDLILPLRKGKTDPIKVSRLATILIMGVGIYVTTIINSISGVWEFILECGAGVGFVLIGRWLWWRFNAWSEIVATVAPFLGYAIGHLWIAPAMGEDFVTQKGTFFFTVGFTLLSILVATLCTSATNDDTLQAFANKVRPHGWWNKYADSGGAKNGRILLVGWVSSIAVCYSALFLIGNLLLAQYQNAGYCAIVLLVSGVICRYSIRRSFSS